MSSAVQPIIVAPHVPVQRQHHAKRTLLNPRYQLFLAEYLKHNNVTLAAISAGYTKRSAYSSGSRLLKMPLVQAELSRLAEMQGITDTYVLESVRAIADEPKAKNQDKLRALELLGKYRKLWTDRVELDVTDLAERVARARERLHGSATPQTDDPGVR